MKKVILVDDVVSRISDELMRAQKAGDLEAYAYLLRLWDWARRWQ